MRDSAYHWFRQWLVAYLAPSHCLNNVSYFVQVVLWWNSTVNKNKTCNIYVHMLLSELPVIWYMSWVAVCVHFNNEKIYIPEYKNAGIILFMGAANEGRCYFVTLSLIGWAHTQKECCHIHEISWNNWVFILPLCADSLSVDSVDYPTASWWKFELWNSVGLNYCAESEVE